MTQPATDLPLTRREKLRWRRAMDAQLIEAIFGRVVRDETAPSLPLPSPERYIESTSVAYRGNEPHTSSW